MVLILNFIPLILVLTQFLLGNQDLNFQTSLFSGVSLIGIDRLAIIMVTYITILCFFILKYAIKNFEREKNGRVWLYWFLFTIFSVHILVLATHLLVMFCSLLLISFGLHRLLLSFPDRIASIRVARKKFLISRIGDISFLLAFYFFYESFQTLEIPVAKEMIYDMDSNTLKEVIFYPTIFLGIGCLIKSAQFPFHVWLPESIDSPTPVSALMHAGIINAGGFILVRFSFLFKEADIANTIIVVIGMISILLGGISMLAQIDIKRKLAFSTLGQMGFMMVEFGLGLYGMVILHLMGHGFYKAYGFLASGTRDLVPAPMPSLGRIHLIYSSMFWVIPILVYFVSQNIELALISLLVYCLAGMLPKKDPLLGIELGVVLIAFGVLVNIIGHFIGDATNFQLAHALDFFVSPRPLKFTELFTMTSLSMLAGFTLSIPHLNNVPFFQKIYCYAQRGFLGTYISDKIYHKFHSIMNSQSMTNYDKIWKDATETYSIKESSGSKFDKKRITQIAQNIPPFFELDSYIAVNPFQGYSSYSYLESMKRWESILEKPLIGIQSTNPGNTNKHRPISDLLGDQYGFLIGGFLGSYLDNSIAYWKFPWKGKNLWESFLSWTKVDPIGKEILNLTAKNTVFKVDPAGLSALECLENLIQANPNLNEDRLETMVYSMFGWAGILRKQDWLRQIHENSDLVAFMTILVYCDLYLSRIGKNILLDYPSKDRNPETEPIHGMKTNLETFAKRFESLVLSESQYRNSLVQKIQANKENAKTSIINLQKVKVKFLFCIDVRSEVIRRNLEKQSNEIATDGFAGFFGMPIGWKHWTGEVITHSPALINPSFVFEDKRNPKNLINSISLTKSWIQKVKRTFPLGFQYVESAGFLSGFGMVSKTFKKFLSNKSYRVISDLAISDSIDSLGDDEILAMAEGFLNGIGWKGNFPDYSVIVGHGSRTTNNPHEAGLACGACAGQSGELSARFLSNLLNSEKTRDLLRKKGITIPDTSLFIPALHETVTDQISLFNKNIPDQEFGSKLNHWMNLATVETRKEKSLKFGLDPKDSLSRAKDWAETFPEQGLAGCGSIILSNRSRLHSINLEGRSFLNSYDWKTDKNSKVLESLLAAPVLVASWINYQYYASTVCPSTFGAGNKILHTVVGNFGVFEGNSWNLKSGLPLQSVHDGKNWIHDPIRLQVFIEAPLKSIDQALMNQPSIQELVKGDWIHLIGFDESGEFSLRKSAGWEKIAI